MSTESRMPAARVSAALPRHQPALPRASLPLAWVLDVFRSVPLLIQFVLFNAMKSIAGLNISASHNHPDDNGGKFYDHTGGQAIPPRDEEMAAEVAAVTPPPPEAPIQDAAAQAASSAPSPLTPLDAAMRHASVEAFYAGHSEHDDEEELMVECEEEGEGEDHSPSTDAEHLAQMVASRLGQGQQMVTNFL